MTSSMRALQTSPDQLAHISIILAFLLNHTLLQRFVDFMSMWIVFLFLVKLFIVLMHGKDVCVG